MSVEWYELYLDILEKYKGIVFKVVCFYCSNEFDWEDLVQEILV